MNMIGNAAAAEINCVVSLCKTFRIFDRNSLPALAAIHRNVEITGVTRSGRTSRLKRSAHDVVRVFRVDGNRNFGRVDRVGIADSHNLLSQSKGRTNANDRRDHDQAARLIYDLKAQQIQGKRSQEKSWLGGRDSNPDSQIQSLESYHWTTSQHGNRIYEVAQPKSNKSSAPTS